MHINVLAALIVAAILAAPIRTVQAQYVIPNVNTGTKSNVPVIAPPQTVIVPDTTVPKPESPSTIDQRCRALTDEQRQETPGCH